VRRNADEGGHCTCPRAIQVTSECRPTSCHVATAASSPSPWCFSTQSATAQRSCWRLLPNHWQRLRGQHSTSFYRSKTRARTAALAETRLSRLVIANCEKSESFVIASVAKQSRATQTALDCFATLEKTKRWFRSSARRSKQAGRRDIPPPSCLTHHGANANWRDRTLKTVPANWVQRTLPQQL